ncbi:MAG: ABC transporter permease [Agromyces sp.]
MTTPAIEAASESSVFAEIAAKSPGRLAWDRFRADRKTIVAAIVVALYALLAILAPILVAVGVLDPFTLNQNLIDSNSLPKGFFGVSLQHPLGVEPGIGRDTLSRIWFGLSFSLMIASLSAILAVFLGVVLGIIAGMSRGWADTVVGRLIDLVLSFPQTLMLLALSGTIIAFLSNTLFIPEGNAARATYVILILAVFGWPPVARLIRGQVLSIREREFIDAARLFGASKRRLWMKEVLPNLWAPILVQFTLILPAYISAETALAYLGVSVVPPTPTIGNILADSVQYAAGDFLYFLLPGLILVIIVVAFNLLGDGIRDALDPKSGRR